MYKDKEKQKEANRLAQARFKAKGITQGITEYPAIIRALVDPKKRAMLEFISEDLKQKHLGHQLSYGVNGPDFDMVGELLEVTR